MGKRVGVEISIAAADAVQMADVDVIAAYPITPQTHIVEHLAELVNNGHLTAEFIPDLRKGMFIVLILHDYPDGREAGF